LLFQVSLYRDTIIPNNYGLAMVKVAPELPTSNNYAYPVNCHRPFQVSGPGDYKYYLTSKVLAGAGNFDNFFNLQLTAMYFPTSYGTVSTSPPQSTPADSGGGKKTEEGRD
jgi:hypothetical protein